MEQVAWSPAWVHEHASELSIQAFRTVETQHVAATMRLVDSADDAFCACAEIAYWRQRFLLDSVGLMKQQLSTELSMYEALIEGRAIDLMAPPWSQAHAYRAHPSDYTQTHHPGQLIRQTAPEVQWIRYASVRAADHVCAAVFDPRSLAMLSPEGRYEQWHCHATHDRVTLSNGRVRFDFQKFLPIPLASGLAGRFQALSADFVKGGSCDYPYLSLKR